MTKLAQYRPNIYLNIWIQIQLVDFNMIYPGAFYRLSCASWGQMFVEIQENVRAARKPLFWTQNQQRIVETLVFTHYVHIFGDMFKLYKWPGLSLMYYLGEKNSKLTCQRDTKRQHINSGLSKLYRTIKSKFGFNCSVTRTHLDPGYCQGRIEE